MTGAAGFIGGVLTDRLLRDGHAVAGLARGDEACAALRSRGVAAVLGDVRDPDAAARLVRDAEVVFHLARAKGHGAAPRAEVEAVNVGGAMVVARAAAGAGVRRMVHCSSTAVYGSRTGDPTVNEDAPLRPDSAYARSKADAEAALGSVSADGLSVVVARITAVLGPGCRSWYSLFRSVAAGRLPVIGRGANWHHPGDVEDIVDGLVRCATPGARSWAYNLAGPEPVPLRTLLQTIAVALGAPPPGTIPAAPVEWYLALDRALGRLAGRSLPRSSGARFLTGDRRLDLGRAAAELGYAPRIGVAAAVGRTVSWYRDAGLLHG